MKNNRKVKDVVERRFVHTIKVRPGRKKKSDLENFGADLVKSLSDRNFIGIYGLEWRKMQNGNLFSFVLLLTLSDQNDGLRRRQQQQQQRSSLCGGEKLGTFNRVISLRNFRRIIF